MQGMGRKFGVILLSPISLLYLTFMIAPIGFFLITSVFKYDPFLLYKPTLTGENFARLIFDSYYRGILLLTLKVAAFTAIFSLILSYPLALFLARTQSAWRGILMFLVIAPLMTGVIVRTYGWIVLFGAKGLINGTLLTLGLIANPLKILNTETAVIIALVHILMPYMVFPLFSSLAAQDPNLERAASTLGAGKVRTFVEVTLPLSGAGIVMGSVLVFTLAAGAIVTPALLGGKNEQMLGQTIYDLVLHTLNWPFASAVAFVLVALQFSIVFVYMKGSRRGVAHAQ